ncbi:phage portal protein [Christensenellaceae bacterium 44-20]
MRIFSKVFGKKTAETVAGIKLITETGNGYYAWDGNVYHSDIVRACIRPKVKAVGKLTPKHIRETIKNGKKIMEINPEPYIRFLLEEPNPYMTGQKLIEKMTAQYCLNNNAFAVIVRDENGYPMQIYPITAITAEAIYDAQGTLYLKFLLQNGSYYTFPYSDIIHLRQDFYSNDIFGEPLAPALAPLMEIINTTDQGIVKAVKNSGVVRWLLKILNSQRPEDIQKTAEQFAKNYLSLESNSVGVAATDAKVDVERIEPKDYVPNAAQIDRTTTRIYALLNTNEKIVHSSYSENDWNSYFESEIETLSIELKNEFTRKIFSRKQRGFGNKIIFEAANLATASMQTKLNLVQFVDRRMMTPNEVRAILNMAPFPGGDEMLLRKDTDIVRGGESVEN